MSANGHSHPKKLRKNMSREVTVVLGAQWGDEGKGKVVDMLACNVDIVCRCQVSIYFVYYRRFNLYFFLIAVVFDYELFFEKNSDIKIILLLYSLNLFIMLIIINFSRYQYCAEK